MKVTFTNSFTEMKCKAVARMLPGVWHGHGFFSGINEMGGLFTYLVRHRFIEGTRIGTSHHKYRLTQQGVILRAQLKAIGL